jgi:hypothetical protein
VAVAADDAELSGASFEAVFELHAISERLLATTNILDPNERICMPRPSPDG